jgi:hypothetical protein
MSVENMGRLRLVVLSALLCVPANLAGARPLAPGHPADPIAPTNMAACETLRAQWNATIEPLLAAARAESDRGSAIFNAAGGSVTSRYAAAQPHWNEATRLRRIAYDLGSQRSNALSRCRALVIAHQRQRRDEDRLAEQHRLAAMRLPHLSGDATLSAIPQHVGPMLSFAARVAPDAIHLRVLNTQLKLVQAFHNEALATLSESLRHASGGPAPRSTLHGLVTDAQAERERLLRGDVVLASTLLPLGDQRIGELINAALQAVVSNREIRARQVAQMSAARNAAAAATARRRAEEAASAAARQEAERRRAAEQRAWAERQRRLEEESRRMAERARLEDERDRLRREADARAAAAAITGAIQGLVGQRLPGQRSPASSSRIHPQHCDLAWDPRRGPAPRSLCGP